MARPQRCRRICGMPQVSSFCPAQQQGQQPILLSLDEYEVIRLVDLEEKSHQQCALQMDISRSTVQEIDESARKNAFRSGISSNASTARRSSSLKSDA